MRTDLKSLHILRICSSASCKMVKTTIDTSRRLHAVRPDRKHQVVFRSGAIPECSCAVLDRWRKRFGNTWGFQAALCLGSFCEIGRISIEVARQTMRMLLQPLSADPVQGYSAHKFGPSARRRAVEFASQERGSSLRECNDGCSESGHSVQWPLL